MVGGAREEGNTEQTCEHDATPFREIWETSRHRGDDEAPAAFVHLQLLDGDAELGEEIQAEAVHRWTLHVHHGHAYRKPRGHVHRDLTQALPGLRRGGGANKTDACHLCSGQTAL